MILDKETRFNEKTLSHETKHEVWLTEDDEYALKWELELRLMQTRAMRDKSGISADDEEAEPNMHIKSIYKLASQLGITLHEY